MRLPWSVPPASTAATWSRSLGRALYVVAASLSQCEPGQLPSGLNAAPAHEGTSSSALEAVTTPAPALFSARSRGEHELGAAATTP
jgi:hypothetical protein